MSKTNKKIKLTIHIKIAIVLFIIAVILLLFAITCTALANIDELVIFSLDPNDVSTYSAGASCLLGVVAIFFTMCGKVWKKKKINTQGFPKEEIENTPITTKYTNIEDTIDTKEKTNEDLGVQI